MANDNSFAEGVVVGQGMGYNNMMPWGMMGGCGGFGGFGGWGNDLLAVIVLAALFGNGGWGNGFGFGGNGGGGQLAYDLGRVATTNDVASGFNNSAVLGGLNDLKLGQSGLQNTLCQGFSGVTAAVNQTGNTINQGIANLGFDLTRQISDCCCGTQRAIDGVNYNMATQACETRRAIEDSTNRVIGFLTNQELDSLRSRNAELTAQLSNNSQTERIINRLAPCPVPAYPACPPVGAYNWGAWSNNGNCGCGC